LLKTHIHLFYFIRYAPPKVPSDFNENHVSNNNQTTPAAKISQDSTFSFEERGKALGETPIEQRSVFDYMPKNAKDRLDRLLHSVTEEVKDKSQLADFPIVTKDVANLALRGFIPFGDNPKKQDRYRDYLENMAGKLTEDGTPKKVLAIPQGLSYEAGMKEMDEFAKAARIFRPISQMMEGRFTSATATSKNMETVSFEGGLKTEEQYRKEREVREEENREPEKKQASWFIS
jgi:G patch domain-containing protein 1